MSITLIISVKLTTVTYVSFQVQTVHSNVNSHLDNNGSNDNGPLTGISDQLIIWFMQEVNSSFSWFFFNENEQFKGERERERTVQ